MRFPLRNILLILAFCLVSLTASAQFRKEAFTQNYNEKDTAVKDTVDKMFSFKEYFGGLAHKNELKVGTMFAGSMVFVGGCQIYNKQYWKLPVVYGMMGAGIGLGVHFNKMYQSTGNDSYRTARALSYACAGLAYWGSLMDGVISYRPNERPHPGKATIYSILVPGLGQAYNGELWKIPIYLGGIMGSVHFWTLNNTNYLRFKRIYLEATNPEGGYTGPVAAETALYYRNVYRRYRDYAIVATIGFYLLQIIDANVFAYMHDFNVSDDLALSVSPTVITPETQLASNNNPALGLRLGFRF